MKQLKTPLLDRVYGMQRAMSQMNCEHHFSGVVFDVSEGKPSQEILIHGFKLRIPIGEYENELAELMSNSVTITT